MKGLELSRAYWEKCALPLFRRELPAFLERAAVGLVGEGSECFGFDDEISQDHDWGPGFSMAGSSGCRSLLRRGNSGGSCPSSSSR